MTARNPTPKTYGRKHQSAYAAGVKLPELTYGGLSVVRSHLTDSLLASYQSQAADQDHVLVNLEISTIGFVVILAFLCPGFRGRVLFTSRGFFPEFFHRTDGSIVPVFFRIDLVWIRLIGNGGGGR